MIRWAAALAAALVVATGTSPAGIASAEQPPVVPPGPPAPGPVAASEPTEQKTACAVGAVLSGTGLQDRPLADAMIDYRGAWSYSRGAGQKVAVIDTGVSRHSRLPLLEPGGDYVSNTDGLEDCDAHGTLVAGLIAARPDAEDGFAGVAPEAAVLAIRQNSAVFAPVGGTQAGPDSTSVGYGNTRTLAFAITRAVDLGATVINLSATACAPSAAQIDDEALGRAVRYAFERDVVVVAVAGNVSSDGLCAQQNDIDDPNGPPANAWKSVGTIASPAWFDDYVLSVGALSPDGRPADFSLRGPWVDVAAPGEQVVSLSPSGRGLMNAYQDAQGNLIPVNGTSFAAPLVSGVVALVRARFPEMSAGEVMDRIERTARNTKAFADGATGYGMVDPVAALTYEVPDAASLPDRNSGRPIAGNPPPGSTETRATHIMLSVVAIVAVLAAAAIAWVRARNSRTTPIPHESKKVNRHEHG